MTVILTILAVVFTLAAAYHIVTPFLASEDDQLRFEALDEDLRRVEELASRRATLLQELRDISLDYETGKISEDVYTDLKRRYERQAVRVMRELDDLHGGRGWEEAIDEKLVERLDELEREREAAEADADRPDTAQTTVDDEPDFIECDECGKRLEPQARFCSRCGNNLSEAPDETADEAASISSPTLPASGSEVAS